MEGPLDVNNWKLTGDVGPNRREGGVGCYPASMLRSVTDFPDQLFNPDDTIDLTDPIKLE